MRLPPVLKTLGPGVLLAATSIGGSHLLLAPLAGAQFGYELLWLVIVAHLFKYHAFEFGPRLALGADMSLLEGYTHLPGPKHWALKLGALDMVLESVGVLAAVAGLSGSILAAWTGRLSVPAWTGIVILVALVMLATGRYKLLSRASLVMLSILALGTTVAFVSTLPSGRDVAAAVTPSLPPGSLLLTAAILGVMPTGAAVSIWHSLWIREDPRFAIPADTSPDDRDAVRHARQRLFLAGLRDMRIGYAFSAVLGIMFLSLGAEVLLPAGLVPEGVDTALTLSRIYTERLGAWMEPLFLLVAFVAMFSTTYTVMDGVPRTLVAAVRYLRGEPDPDRSQGGPVYWGFLLIVVPTSLAVVAAVPNPVVLFLIMGTINLLFNPLYYILNTWCVTHLIEDSHMKPSRRAVWMAHVGIVFMLATTALVIYTEIFVRLLGGGD